MGTLREERTGLLARLAQLEKECGLTKKALAVVTCAALVARRQSSLRDGVCLEVEAAPSQEPVSDPAAGPVVVVDLE